MIIGAPNSTDELCSAIDVAIALADQQGLNIVALHLAQARDLADCPDAFAEDTGSN